MSENCPYTLGRLTSLALAKVITQYRESTNFNAFISVFMSEVEVVEEMLCSLVFNVDDATGDQLDIIGTSAGWPRCHCRGSKKVFFGFSRLTCDCNPGDVLGWCDGEWVCRTLGEKLGDYEEYCFTDDDLYRNFIKAKIRKNTSKGTIDEVIGVAQLLFGPDACMLREGHGHAWIGTGRELTLEEKRIIGLYKLVIPNVRGVSLHIVEGADPFGFGTGWDGWCDGEFGIEVS